MRVLRSLAYRHDTQPGRDGRILAGEWLIVPNREPISINRDILRKLAKRIAASPSDSIWAPNQGALLLCPPADSSTGKKEN
jgi:hypothetical protein